MLFVHPGLKPNLVGHRVAVRTRPHLPAGQMGYTDQRRVTLRCTKTVGVDGIQEVTGGVVLRLGAARRNHCHEYYFRRSHGVHIDRISLTAGRSQPWSASTTFGDPLFSGAERRHRDQWRGAFGGVGDRPPSRWAAARDVVYDQETLVRCAVPAAVQAFKLDHAAVIRRFQHPSACCERAVRFSVPGVWFSYRSGPPGGRNGHRGAGVRPVGRERNLSTF